MKTALPLLTTLLLAQLAALHAADPVPVPLWDESVPLLKTAELPVLKHVRFSVIKRYEFANDGYRFLHGMASCFHKGRLDVSFGHNQGGENTDTEETLFSKVLVIRHAEFTDGPGESHPKAALSYPYAIEHEGKLYVGHSNSGGGVGRIGEGRELWNNNSAELAIIPVAQLLVENQSSPQSEPTNINEAAAQKVREEAELDKQYQAWVANLSPAQQAWEKILQAELGDFYLPIHKREKVAGKSNAWDFVEDDPALPRVLLIGDSVSRAYTQTVRKELAGIANVHRAPANCGPTSTGLKKIDAWLGEGKWDVIHFNFGIHDRATPLADYATRLEQLVERMQQTGAKLVWASTTPIPDVADKYSAESIVHRNAAAAEVMQKNGVAIDDLFTTITPRLAELQNANDVHFTGPGNEFLGEQVAAFLKSIIPIVSGPGK